MASAGEFSQLLKDGASAAQVFAALGALDQAGQAAAVAGLDPELRRHLPGPRHESHLSEAHKALIQVMFDHTPDSEPETLAHLLGVRFRVHVGKDPDRKDGQGPQQWEAGGLRRMWRVLAALPPADVEENERLWNIGRFAVPAGQQAEGMYGQVTAVIGYDPQTVAQPDKDFSEGPGERGRGKRGAADPLWGVNAFDETMRHEVGHAVDMRLSATEQHASEPAWGGWREFGKDVQAVAQAMVESAAGPIHDWGDAAQRGRLIEWLAKRLERGDTEHAEEALAELEFLDEAGRKHVQGDAALLAALHARVSEQQWMDTELDGGMAIGGRVYQESYAGRWYSYDHAARARKVSLYQFRAPREWFAEAYAAYYEPFGERPEDRGCKLRERDPQMCTWIKENVDHVHPDR